jgi:hypothetical protein
MVGIFFFFYMSTQERERGFELVTSASLSEKFNLILD